MKSIAKTFNENLANESIIRKAKKSVSKAGKSIGGFLKNLANDRNHLR